MSVQELIRICDIDADHTIQQRYAGLDSEHVDDLVRYYDRGDDIPSPDVFRDGKKYVLADGFHRVEACRKRGAEHVLCNIHQGNRSQAILFACKSNVASGLKRTNKDKRKAVLTLIRIMPDDTSNRKIAEMAGVHPTTVTSARGVSNLDTPATGGPRSEDEVGILPEVQLEEWEVDLPTALTPDEPEPEWEDVGEEDEPEPEPEPEPDYSREGMKLGKLLDKVLEALVNAHKETLADSYCSAAQDRMAKYLGDRR